MDINLRDGKLYLPGLNEDKIRKFYHRFRIDLLDCKIPHYRPIAFMVNDAEGSVSSNITKIPKFGYSYAELSFLLQNIVTFEKKGIMPTALNQVANTTVLKSDCSYLGLTGTSIGTDSPGSMFYAGEGMSSSPKLLLKNTVVFDKLRNAITITVILHRNIRERDFWTNQRMIFGTYYRPMRTTYSLNEFFTIYEYLGGEFIELNYLEDIDEEVLIDILKNYVRQEEVLKCLE